MDVQSGIDSVGQLLNIICTCTSSLYTIYCICTISVKFISPLALYNQILVTIAALYIYTELGIDYD